MSEDDSNQKHFILYFCKFEGIWIGTETEYVIYQVRIANFCSVKIRDASFQPTRIFTHCSLSLSCILFIPFNIYILTHSYEYLYIHSTSIKLNHKYQLIKGAPYLSINCSSIAEVCWPTRCTLPSTDYTILWSS